MLDLIIDGGCSFEIISLGAQIISIDALINDGFITRKSDPYATEELRKLLPDLGDLSAAITRDSAAYLNAIPTDSEDWQAVYAALAGKLTDYLAKLTEIYKRL